MPAITYSARKSAMSLSASTPAIPLWEDGIRTLATITETTDYAEGVRRTSVAQFEISVAARLSLQSDTSRTPLIFECI